MARVRHLDIRQRERERLAVLFSKLMLCALNMALPVMEFQDQGYKIRKKFAKKSIYTKEIIQF